MDSPKILDYWISFFRDLLVGTLKKLFIFGFAGLGLGILSILAFDSQVLDVAGWNSWLETSIFILAQKIDGFSKKIGIKLLFTWLIVAGHIL